jgi:hypothetical protein
MIAQLAQAMTHGIKLRQIANTIHAYPTYPEAIRHASEMPAKAGFTGTTKALVGWLVRRG